MRNLSSSIEVGKIHDDSKNDLVVLWICFRILSLLLNQYSTSEFQNRSSNVDRKYLFVARAKNANDICKKNVTEMNYVFPNFMKVMKILCYSAKLVAGLNVERNPDLAKRFAIVSSKISGARATLRLIDDIPMLQHTLEYGLGSKVQ